MAREQFAAQIDSNIAESIRSLAQDEGRKVDALVEEALCDLIQKHHQPGPRPRVTSAYLASHEKSATLYKKLAE